MPDVRAFLARSVPEHVYARPRLLPPMMTSGIGKWLRGRESDGPLAGGYTRTLLKMLAVKGEGTKGKRVRVDALAHM